VTMCTGTRTTRFVLDNDVVTCRDCGKEVPLMDDLFRTGKRVLEPHPQP
jgi:hypothetical protein